MITKVKLKNWRSHLDSDMAFSEGTNCFVGRTGTGKTSVMDAICFGLFGTFLQLQQKKMKLEDIIMKKPVQKDQAEVSVYFDVDGTEWNVKRTVTKGKSSAELRKDGELIEGPQASKVTEELEKILKMNYELFSRAVYSEQNQLDMFLTIPKGQRMKKIDELLSIDKFEKARINTKSIKNKCLTALTEREELLKTFEADESLRKIETVKREFVELKEKEEEFKKQLEDVVKRKLTTAKDLMIMKDQQRKLQDVNEDVKKYTALIEVTDSDLEKLKNDLVDFAEKTTEELNSESSSIDEEIEKLSCSITDEKSNLDKLRDSYAEENAKIKLLEEEKLPRAKQEADEFETISEKLKKNSSKKIETDINGNQKELEKNQMNLQKSLAKISEVEDSIRELGLAGSACPICNSKLTDARKSSLLSKKKEQLSELNKTIDKSRPMIENIQENLGKLGTKLKEVQKLEERLEQIKDSNRQLKLLNSELKDFKDKVKVFTNQKKMFEKNIYMLESNLNDLKKKQDDIKLVISKKDDANIKLDRIKEYGQKLSQLMAEKEMFSSFSITILEKVEQDYQNIIGLEKELQTRLSNQNDIISEKQKLLNEIEGKKRTLENYRQEMKRLEAIAEQLQLLENSLEATQDQLRKDFVTTVNDAMQSLWPELYPYKDIFGIRLGVEENDYVLELQDSTGWIAADGIASGGERSIACLALRIALSLVLAPNVDMLVLDEPTANLDAQSIDVLASVLRENITQLIGQCFLITHDEKLKEAVSGYCYELTRDKSKNESTKVSLISGPES